MLFKQYFVNFIFKNAHACLQASLYAAISQGKTVIDLHIKHQKVCHNTHTDTHTRANTHTASIVLFTDTQIRVNLHQMKQTCDTCKHGHTHIFEKFHTQNTHKKYTQQREPEILLWHTQTHPHTHTQLECRAEKWQTIKERRKERQTERKETQERKKMKN